MKLVRVQPFNGFENVVRRMNHLMSDLDVGGSVLDRSAFNQSSNLSARVDIAEDKTHYFINAELPGVLKEDLKVSVNAENVLTISAEKKQELKTDEKNFHRVERRYGTVSRSFTLPKNVRHDNIAAKFEHGILELSIPKMEDEKLAVRDIEVK